MTDETKLERFHVPTLAQLEPLRSNTVGDEELEKVRAILAGELDPCEASPKCAAWVKACYNRPDTDSYECKLQACDDILGTSGVEALDFEDAPHYTDEGIRMCPPFSYCNAGDTYAVTLLRDHSAGMWLVACWGECPDCCPSCHGKVFSLEHFPGSARGPSYSWVCDSCNHHCFAEDSEGTIQIGETDDFDPVCVRAVKVGERPIGLGKVVGTYEFVLMVGTEETTRHASAEDARQAWLTRESAALGVEDDCDDEGGDVPGTGDDA
jgi:hypothetical protein